MWLLETHAEPNPPKHAMFGSLQVEEVTPTRVDSWRSGLVVEGRLSNRTVNKLLTILDGILERARKRFNPLSNPVAEVEKQPRKRRVSIDVFSTEEVLALVRKADTEQDGTIFLTAAFTGLRMGELLALRWRDVDFPLQAVRVRASYSCSGHGLRSSVGPCRDGACHHSVCGVGGGGSGADVRGQLRQPVVPRVQARSVEFELRGRGSEPAHGAVALLRPAVSACHGTDGTALVRTRLAA